MARTTLRLTFMRVCKDIRFRLLVGFALWEFLATVDIVLTARTDVLAATLTTGVNTFAWVTALEKMTEARSKKKCVSTFIVLGSMIGAAVGTWMLR